MHEHVYAAPKTDRSEEEEEKEATKKRHVTTRERGRGKKEENHVTKVKNHAQHKIDAGAKSDVKRKAKQFRKLNHLNRKNVFTVKDKETKRKRKKKKK